MIPEQIAAYFAYLIPSFLALAHYGQKIEAKMNGGR